MKIVHHSKEKKDPKPHSPRHTRPAHEDIQLAAYYRWVERGSPEEDDGQEDWYMAENKWRDNIVPGNND